MIDKQKLIEEIRNFNFQRKVEQHPKLDILKLQPTFEHNRFPVEHEKIEMATGTNDNGSTIIDDFWVMKSCNNILTVKAVEASYSCFRIEPMLDDEFSHRTLKIKNSIPDTYNPFYGRFICKELVETVIPRNIPEYVVYDVYYHPSEIPPDNNKPVYKAKIANPEYIRATRNKIYFESRRIEGIDQIITVWLVHKCDGPVVEKYMWLMDIEDCYSLFEEPEDYNGTPKLYGASRSVLDTNRACILNGTFTNLVKRDERYLDLIPHHQLTDCYPLFTFDANKYPLWRIKQQ